MITYDNIESLNVAEDLQSWPSSQSPVFKELIDEIKPKNIIEVGSWKGVSALVMAEAGKPYGTHIHCVDTWLGSYEHFITNKDKLPRDAWGYPQLFHQFLANVKKSGYQDSITPYPMCSVDGARWLSAQKITAPLIYIDGAHDMETVYQDCRMYWSLLEKGGIMFGDDHLVFASVFAGVIRFACERGIDMTTKAPFWILRK
jgi:predicted O-methyltransferase YrrM